MDPAITTEVYLRLEAWRVALERLISGRRQQLSRPEIAALELVERESWAALEGCRQISVRFNT